MERRILEVSWSDGMGVLPRGEDYAQITAEALRLSVWRVNCVVLGCAVTAREVRLVVQCGGSDEPRALIDWVRAAASFAISCYTGYAPEWDAPYEYAWLDPECAGVAILRCLALQHQGDAAVVTAMPHPSVL